MGFFKERALEQSEAGFSAPYGGAVCADCVADEALKEFVNENVSSEKCSFCGQAADEWIAADADDVLQFIGRRLQTEWSDANNELYRDADEGRAASPGRCGTSATCWERRGKSSPARRSKSSS
jgi:Zn ribbon nucleic-acid-binding protein